MEKHLMELTPEYKKVITENQDKVKTFMALSLFTETTKEPMALLSENLVHNIQEVSSWEDIKERQLDFAEQVLDMFPENYDETYEYIQTIKPLQGEELKEYLTESGFFLYPYLNIAFSLDKNIIEEYQIKQIA